MFIAALDTCVLYPSLQRDLLLSLASERLFRPLWSDVTLEGLRYHKRRKLIQRVGLPEEEATHRYCANMADTLDIRGPDTRTLTAPPQLKWCP